MVKVNWANVKAPEPVPAGTYDAAFTDFELKPNSDGKGGEHFSCTFTLKEAEYDGRKVFRNYALTPDSLPYFKRFLSRLGADDDALEAAEEVEDVLNDLKGADCRVKVRTKVFQGEQRNEVQDVLAAVEYEDEEEG